MSNLILPSRQLLAILAFAIGGAAVAQVQVVDVPLLPPGDSCYPIAGGLNENGQFLMRCGGLSQKTYVWSIGDQSAVELVPPAGYTSFEARALNNSGQVVGLMCGSAVGCAGFLWSPTAGFSLLPSAAHSINDLGEILLLQPLRLRRADGSEVTPSIPDGWHPASYRSLNNLSQVLLVRGKDGGAVWSAATGFAELPPPPIDIGRIAANYGINDAGQVLGYALEIQSNFRYTPGQGYEILVGGSSAWGDSLNQLGEIAGGKHLADFVGYVAVLYRSPTNALDLGLWGGSSTWANSSNSSGYVVGASDDGFGNSRVLVWRVPSATPPTPEQQVTQVSSLLASLIAAGAISASDAKGLTSKIDAASLMLTKGDTPATKNLLQALSNQISALEKSKRLDSGSADSLRATIAAAVATL
jgi:hypothetical protein